MKVGTKSILFGMHQFLIHPWFVAWAWQRLYGFPCDPRLWVAFFIHDLGYWGLANMDGAEGELHPMWAALKMQKWFDKKPGEFGGLSWDEEFHWHDFCLYHSRFLAKQDECQFSKLCVADKLSFVLTPRWLYLLLANLSGEIHEYMTLPLAKNSKYTSMAIFTKDQRTWHDQVRTYLAAWVTEHKDCRADTWTPKIYKSS